MANTLAGTASQAIANRGLAAFNLALAPMIGTFTTDFGDQAAVGNKVVTRVVPASNAAVSLTALAGDRTHATVCADVTTAEVSIDLVDYAVGFRLTDEEVAAMAAGVMQDTKDKLLEKKANALAAKVQALAFALVTNGNYSTAIHTGATAAFDYSKVSAIRTAVNKLNWVGKQSLVLNSDAAGTLRDDNAIKSRLDSNKDTLESGIIGKVAGFGVVEAPSLPNNSENLFGFACTPDAIAIACRPTKCQQPDQLMAYEVVTDPVTGVVMVYRAFYQASNGTAYHTFEIACGVKTAVAAALKRLVTA